MKNILIALLLAFTTTAYANARLLPKVYYCKVLEAKMLGNDGNLQPVS